MAKVWFTSDTHYAHRNSMRYCGRPFFTVDNCDEAMIERWNAVVAPDDIVFHLGDVSMHITPIKRIIPRLNGRKFLIVGNHDLMYPYFEKTRGKAFVERMTAEYKAAGFEQVLPSGIIFQFMFDNKQVVEARLCHFPTKNAFDSYHNNKHDAARPEDTGVLNICGHVHQSWLKRGNNINVGVDVWNFAPVSMGTVLTLFNNVPGDIETPHKLRIAIWKIYHTIMWRVRQAFNLITGRGKK